ncbi:MAG: hypothetical protein E6G07_11150 [Actinobacteria bacterium]|nr:MAG: hypothetical protein E6G07_11150 [Actinomycetota bacterium]
MRARLPAARDGGRGQPARRRAGRRARASRGPPCRAGRGRLAHRGATRGLPRRQGAAGGRARCGGRGGPLRARFVGEVHPAVLREWDLEVGAAFEVDAGALAELAPGAVHYREVTSFPAVLQDIAVVVPEEVPAAEVEAAVRVGGGELLAEARVFDVYHGEQVGEGERSLALRLRFQAPDRTLTDEDVAELRSAIESRVAELGGRLRA